MLYCETTPWEIERIKLAILGRYNLYNVLGVVGIALKLGIEKEIGWHGWDWLVPGRPR